MAATMLRPRALIIGGSVGGLFAASLFRTIGWDVAVFERSGGDLSERGAGLGATPELFAVLERIGVALDASIMGHVRGRIFVDRDGSVAGELKRNSRTSSWGQLYQALRAVVPDTCYHGGVALEQVEQDARGVTAIFSDGSRAAGDLLIAADGLFSTVRRLFLPDVTPAYAGYVGWRAIVRESDLPPEVRDTITGRLTFGGPDGELVICVPMAGREAAGQRRLHYTWYRWADYERTLPDLCTDAQGHCHGVSIPPPLVRQDLVEGLLAQAEASLAPQFVTVMQRGSRPFLQPIWDLESPSIVFGRIVLVGDAAFVARPHVATGVSKVALDMQCLVDALGQGQGIDDALAHYAWERGRFGQGLVARGRHLGAWIHPPGEAKGDLPAGERAAGIATLLNEYGAAGVVGGTLPVAGL
jgi:2-polyprenyl-6-methoxyphenol hydroxylase-like FAD-dependent oxidoreductase